MDSVKKQTFFFDVVTAMLSVNKWSLDQTASIIPSLRIEGFSEPMILASCSHEEVALRLERAGYKRGTYIVSRMADWIICASLILSEDSMIEKLVTAEETGDIKTIQDSLARIKGVGPGVRDTFLRLRGIRS